MRKGIFLASIISAVVFSAATILFAALSLFLLTTISASLSLLALCTHFLLNKSESASSAGSERLFREKRNTGETATAGDERSDSKKDSQTSNEQSETEFFSNSTTHRDEESGLFDQQFFPVFIEQRITAARRTLRPVSLVTFEIDGLDPSKMKSAKERLFFIESLGDVISKTLRESDCAFRISTNTFAAVMDDTSEAGAVWAAERVRGVLHTGVLAGRVTVCAGVACYPSHALDPKELIETSNEALENAKARGFDQVEIASIP